MNDDNDKPKVVTTKKKFGNKKVIKGLLIILIAIALVGVGVALERYVLSSTKSSDKPTLVTVKKSNLCDLVSQEDVSDIFKLKLTKNSSESAFAADTGIAESLGPCIFTSSNERDFTKSESVSYYALRFDNSTEAKSYFDNQTSQIKDKEQINNINQSAVWVKSFNQLMVVNDKYVFYVNSSPSSEKNKEKIIDLGKLVSENIQSTQ